MLLQRLDNQAPSQHPDLPECPSVTACRLYYDTVGHGSQAALLYAWKAFGADHQRSAIHVACPYGDQEAHGVSDVVARTHLA